MLAFHKLVPFPSLQPAPSYLLWPISQCQQGVRFLLGVRGEGALRLNLCHGELTFRKLVPLPSPTAGAFVFTFGLSAGFSEGCSFYLEYVEEEPGD